MSSIPQVITYELAVAKEILEGAGFEVLVEYLEPLIIKERKGTPKVVRQKMVGERKIQLLVAYDMQEGF